MFENLNHPNPAITKSCRQEANDGMLTSTTKAANVSLSVQDLGNPEKRALTLNESYLKHATYTKYTLL